MKHSKTIKLTLSAMFLALGFVLPFFTGQIPQIGNMLLPMHLPVLLCGLICGWQYGLVIGPLSAACTQHDFWHAAYLPDRYRYDL